MDFIPGKYKSTLRYHTIIDGISCGEKLLLVPRCPFFCSKRLVVRAFEIVLFPEGSAQPATSGLVRLIPPFCAGCVGRVSLPPASPAVMKI